MTKQPEFGVFVSSVEGRIVRRYGQRQRVYIGARTKGAEPGGDDAVMQREGWSLDTEIIWDTAAIVAIPAKEFRLFGREYRRAIREGSLKERTRAEWEAQNKAQKTKAAEGAQAQQSTGSTASA